MVAQFRQNLESALSNDRLESYRPPNGNDLEMLATYFWNVGLCESLYPSLGALEKSFRNTLSNSLSIEFGRQDWYDEPGFLEKREAMAVYATKFDLVREGKSNTPGRTISRQDFGFWTGLYSKGYRVWTENHAAATKRAFPFAPPAVQYRSRQLAHINEIRQFRNRVFHYESIINGITLQSGAHVPVMNMHANIIEAIGWINPTYQNVIQRFDRFPSLYGGGPSIIEAQLRAHLGISP